MGIIPIADSMGYIDTKNRNLGNNVNFLTLATMPDSTGQVTGQGAPPPTARNASNQSADIMGSWYRVPNGAVKMLKGAFTERYVWNLGGSYVELNPDEIKFDAPIISYVNLVSPFAALNNQEYNLTNVYVKLTPNTLPGLKYIGAIRSQKVADEIINREPKPSATQPGFFDKLIDTVDKTGTNAAIGAGAIAVVALVVAAIYFLPKTGGN